MLEGKLAVVTGGANGIGRALVQELIEQRARVAVCDVDSDALASLVRAFGDGSGLVHSEDVDVSDRSAMLRFAERLHDRHGPVHALFNNAGVGGEWGSLYRHSQADFSWCMNINLNGVLHGIEAFVGRMVAAGERAFVVNVASVSGILPSPEGGAYSPSKFAVVSLTEGLAAELAGTQVSATLLCPGFVDTKFLDSGRKLAGAPRARHDEAWLVERRERVGAIMRKSMAPRDVARKAIAGMLRGDLYVFTHSEFRTRFEDRMAKIFEALDRAERPNDGQGV
jgi:NAD(P)-dependent dehydrogenase (short-subunit alcohol dehydrogenase family)